MPKPILEPVPTSSVARLFDLGAAARALAPVSENPAGEQAGVPAPTATPVASLPPFEVPVTPPQRQPASPHAGMPAHAVVPTGEPANIKRELVLSPSTDEAFGRLVDLYRRSPGARLTGSQVARAMLKAVAHAMPHVEREARKIGAMRLPSDARGREGERDRFEGELARAFLRGIKASADFES